MHPSEDVDLAKNQITEDEITSALRAMNNRKAEGENDFSSENVKWLKKIFNTAYNEERNADDWSLAAICPIYKNKGRKTDCGRNNSTQLCQQNV